MENKRRVAAVVVMIALALTSVTYTFADQKTTGGGVTGEAVSEGGSSPPGATDPAAGSDPGGSENSGNPDNPSSPGTAEGAEATEDPAAPATDSGIERADAGRGTAPAGISPATVTEEFISIEQHIGEHAVAGAVTAATSSAVAQATFEDGRISATRRASPTWRSPLPAATRRFTM
jgi:hypothetical protein